MMAKTYIFIFSFFLSAIIYSKDISKESRERINSLEKSGEFEKLIPILENSIRQSRNEIPLNLHLARAYILRNDLEVPNTIEDVFSKNSKFNKLQENYKTASLLFATHIPEIENRTPSDKELGKWYFYWGISELFLNKKDRAFFLFKKSVKLDEELIECYYNMAIISYEKGLLNDSEKYFKLYKEKIKSDEK